MNKVKYYCRRYNMDTSDKDFCTKRLLRDASGCERCNGLEKLVEGGVEEMEDTDIKLCKECLKRPTYVKELCKRCYQSQWRRNKKQKTKYVCIEPDCPNVVSKKGRWCLPCVNRIKAKQIKEALIVTESAVVQAPTIGAVQQLDHTSIEVPIETNMKMMVDFTNYPELYKRICEDAAGYFRPVPEHIVALTAQVWECYFYDKKEWETGFYKSTKKLYLMTEEKWMPNTKADNR